MNVNEERNVKKGSEKKGSNEMVEKVSRELFSRWWKGLPVIMAERFTGKG